MVVGVRKGTVEFYVPRNACHVKCQQLQKMLCNVLPSRITVIAKGMRIT